MSINEIADRKEPHNKDCPCEYCEELELSKNVVTTTASTIKCEFCSGEDKNYKEVEPIKEVEIESVKHNDFFRTDYSSQFSSDRAFESYQSNSN